MNKAVLLTVEGINEGIFRDKGSRFLAYLFPCNSQDKLNEKLSELKKEHFKAKHHCYAYRFGIDKFITRANDDGEPSGTAGLPIQNQIISANLSDAAIIVVRYFGGTLLGTTGLIRAYKTAASEAIDTAKLIPLIAKLEITALISDYAAINRVLSAAKRAEMTEISKEIITPPFRLTFQTELDFDRAEKILLDAGAMEVTA